MTRGHPLSNDLRIALICMGKHLPLDAVTEYSGVPVRTIQRLFADYRRDGHALRRKQNIQMRGARPKLTFDDMGVSNTDFIHGFYSHGTQFVVGQVQQRRDIYLLGLQAVVSHRLGIEVSESAIWKALRKRGFTMKKVCGTLLDLFSILILNKLCRLRRLPLSVMRNEERHFSTDTACIALRRALSLLTRAHLTGGQHFKTGHGHYGVVRRSESGFLLEVDGA